MTVDVECDKGLDVELLFTNSVFVRILVESYGDELDDDLFSADDQRNDE